MKTEASASSCDDLDQVLPIQSVAMPFCYASGGRIVLICKISAARSESAGSSYVSMPIGCVEGIEDST